MPYIKEERREVLDGYDPPTPKTPGELNYKISQEINWYLLDKWKKDSPINYNTINEVIGVFECCKLELYRRLSWYEDQKIIENGDVYFKDFTGGSI